MTQRSKNRLREHSGEGHVNKLHRVGNPTCFNYRPAALFQCTCGWLGWIPLEDLDLPMKEAT